MMDAGVEAICTYNTKDFAGHPVTAITPEDILHGKKDSPLVHDRPRE
jgi:hypothetical protein